MARTAWIGLAVVALTACTNDFDAFLPVEDGGGVDAVGVDLGFPSDTAPGSDAAPACTESGAKTFGGHCYFPIAAGNWNKVRGDCESRGAHLVTIGSAEEQDAVAAIRPGRDRWIGLSRPKGSASTAASFAWITGEPKPFERWNDAEPDGSGECARLRTNDRWADTGCNSAHEAICERE